MSGIGYQGTGNSYTPYSAKFSEYRGVMHGFQERKRPRKGGARTHLRWIVRIGCTGEREWPLCGSVRQYHRKIEPLDLFSFALKACKILLPARGLTFSRKKGRPGVPRRACSAKRQREAQG